MQPSAHSSLEPEGCGCCKLPPYLAAQNVACVCLLRICCLQRTRILSTTTTTMLSENLLAQ